MHLHINIISIKNGVGLPLLNSKWHLLLKVWEVSAKTAGAYYVDFFPILLLTSAGPREHSGLRNSMIGSSLIR